MNRKPQLNASGNLIEKMNRLDLDQSGDAEVAPTHGLSRKVPPRPIRNESNNQAMSVSNCELGIRAKCVNESSSQSSNGSLIPVKRQLSSTGSSATLIAPRLSSTKNFTFNSNQMREIERSNQLLMKKILHTKVTADIRRSASSTNLQIAQGLTPSAAINRKKQQRQIDIGNDILQKKLMRISRRRPTLVPK